VPWLFILSQSQAIKAFFVFSLATWDLSTEMMINISGPGSSDFLLQTPKRDASVDIGRAAKRYRKSYIKEVVAGNVIVLPVVAESLTEPPPVGALNLHVSENKLYQMDSALNIQQVATTGEFGNYLPLDGSVAMAGDMKMATNDITNVGVLAGNVNSRSADDIVSNSSPVIAGHFPAFLTPTTLVDSGIAVVDIATTTAMETADNLRISGPVSAVSGNVVTFSDTTGKLAADSGIAASGLATTSAMTTADNLRMSGPASAVSGNVVTFSDTTGKLAADSGIAASGLATTSAMTTADNLRVLKTGDSMSGPLNVTGGLQSNDNGGAGVKTLDLTYGPALAYCKITSYQQSVGTRDLMLSQRNLGINSVSDGGGDQVICIANRLTAPVAFSPVGGGVLYAEGGALKWKGSSGTITTIAVP
jgi:hypothetical protein